MLATAAQRPWRPGDTLVVWRLDRLGRVENLVRNVCTMAPTIGPMDVAYLGECAERAFPPAVA